MLCPKIVRELKSRKEYLPIIGGLFRRLATVWNADMAQARFSAGHTILLSLADEFQLVLNNLQLI